MCSIYREMKLYHYLQIRLIKPTVKGFLVYMRIMVCNEKSCTLLPSGIWLICILFVSLNFFLFPHGMWVIFFFVCASVGLWMTYEQVLISAGYSTSRKAWAVKQGHASKGLRDLALASNLRDHSLISCIACPLTCQPTRKFRCSCPNTSEMLFAGYGCGSRNESVTKGGWQDERLECGSKYTDVTYEFSIIASHSLFFFYNDQSRRPLSITLSCLLHSLQSFQFDFLAWLHEEENVTLPDNTTHKITCLST